MGISDRGTKAKTITSCDNVFVTNLVLAQAAHRTPLGSSALRESEASAANVLSVRKRSNSNKCFICAKAKRQQQMFYLCESEATATNVLSARKRSVSGKAPSRNGNQPNIMIKFSLESYNIRRQSWLSYYSNIFIKNMIMIQQS
ncbi:hypothetical protein [Lysinibacillus xylanilyticus]|uniref:hypothetical protein n=1 Tax=Lysinibacillus xylanilyticus TaxID=582475 RepID=UPI003D069DB1